jgi:hypothetical protein
MLSEIDDPVAVSFTVEEMASVWRRIEVTKGFSPFAASLPDHWRRHQEEDGTGMSDASRHPLQALWIDASTDKHLRKAAFRLWAATHAASDLALLRMPNHPADLADEILQERLSRSDHSAIPAVVKKIEDGEHPWVWWYMIRYVWSDDLLGVLDAALQRRAKAVAPDWDKHTDADTEMSKVIMRLAPEVGEALLKKHWTQLKHINCFIHAALYLATPTLQNMVGDLVATCPDPNSVLQYIVQHMEFGERGHPGITREAQILALTPYVAYLRRHETTELWAICNKYGWFALRRSRLDPHLRATNGILYEDEAPTFAALDDMVEKNNVYWARHWLERYAETGATTDMIISRVGAWLAQRRTLGALILVHEVLVTIGRRGDLAILDTALDAPEPIAGAIRADAVFAVRRRTLR